MNCSSRSASCHVATALTLNAAWRKPTTPVEASASVGGSVQRLDQDSSGRPAQVDDAFEQLVEQLVRQLAHEVARARSQPPRQADRLNPANQAIISRRPITQIGGRSALMNCQ